MMAMTPDLPDVCEKLSRDAGARKVMLCANDGEVLAHAGATGSLDDAVAEALAQLVADVVQQAALVGPLGPVIPGGSDDIVITLRGTLQACAAPAGPRAALVVVFDGSTSLERVRQKMRRARTVLEKTLAEPPKPESNQDPS
jgi:hypothetical protein